VDDKEKKVQEVVVLKVRAAEWTVAERQEGGKPKTRRRYL
jgi:hypothetical protein